MGYIINPISFRLGYNRFYNFIWSNSISLNNFHLLNIDLFITYFLNYFFSKKVFRKLGILFYNFKIFRFFNYTFLNIYFYNFYFLNFFNDLLVNFLNLKIFRWSHKLKIYQKHNCLIFYNFLGKYRQIFFFNYKIVQKFDKFLSNNLFFHKLDNNLLFKSYFINKTNSFIDKKYSVIYKQRFLINNLKFLKLNFSFKLAYSSFFNMIQKYQNKYKSLRWKFGYRNMKKFKINFTNRNTSKKFYIKNKIFFSKKRKGLNNKFRNRKLKRNHLNSKFLIRLDQNLSDKFFLKKFSFDKNKVFLIVRFLVYYKLYFFFEKFFWNFMKIILYFNLKKFLNNSNSFFIKFFSISNYHFNAKFLTNYINFRLKQGFYFYQIKKKIFKTLLFFVKSKYLLGFKLSFKGRFSRRQRASFSWRRVRSVPANTKSSWLDYSMVSIPLRYSLCSIKVWLTFSKLSDKKYFYIL